MDIQESHPEKKNKLEIVLMTLKEANFFVEQNHRHHGKVVGHKFSIGLSDGEKIVGVVIVGRPVSRYLDDGWTLGLVGFAPLEIETPALCFMQPHGELLELWGTNESLLIYWKVRKEPAFVPLDGNAWDKLENFVGRENAAPKWIYIQRK